MFTDVKEAINFIETRKRFREKTSLENMYKLCALFDNPQNELKYIHVTGTNGKGSTSLFLTNILMEAGLNVGTYVSPYVTCFNERIEYNKEYIPDQELLELTNLIMSKQKFFDNDNIFEPSFFEFCTLICFLYFQKKKPDIIVLEVGMGGLLDSTNIIIPLASVITNVKMDHMKTLGNTVEEICMNKLGIVKKEKPLFTIYDERLHHLIKSKTEQTNSELIEVNRDDIKNIQLSLNNTIFDYQNLHIILKLLGKYQTENAAIAVEVSKYLNNNKIFRITDDNIIKGLEKTLWPGRLEVVSSNPTIILDGAHNIDGILRLKEFLQTLKKDYKILICFAVSSDKEKNIMIQEIEDIADEIIFTKFMYKRSDDANYLYSISNHPRKKVVEDVDSLYQLIVNDKRLVVCCGSLYFVSELRKKFISD